MCGKMQNDRDKTCISLLYSVFPLTSATTMENKDGILWIFTPGRRLQTTNMFTNDG